MEDDKYTPKNNEKQVINKYVHLISISSYTINISRQKKTKTRSTINNTWQHGRTSDGGNGNHSVSLPIILIKIKVNQMLPSSYISSLLVSIL